jgi:outer membrane protein TolC
MRFGEVPKRVDAAQEQYRLADLALQDARINVVSQTRRIFYDIILIENELEQRQALRNEIEKKLERTKERVNQRLALELEQLAVEQEMAEQELSINELKRNLRVRKVELLQTIGADEEAEIEISGDLPDIELKIDACIAAAMVNHVDLKDLRGQIERQERIVKEVLWELLPEFRTAYRYKDTSLILEQEDRTWDTSLAYDKPIWEKEGGLTPKRDKWEFSLSLGFPIFDGFRVKGIMQTEQARLGKLKTELIQREKRVRLEVRQAYYQVADQKENMEIKQKVVTLREKTLTRMEAIMETPVISQKYPHLAGITFDDVIRAREQYTDAQRDYFAQRRNYMLAQENLRQNMGLVE